MQRSFWGACLLTLGLTASAHGQSDWNTPQAPFRIFGNTYYVGTRGLAAIFVTSDRGHVLIDGALPESAPLIAANIQTLGFQLRDVKLILNSHAHFDHAGGIAELQRLTGASVAASAATKPVLESGKPSTDDPQFGVAPEIARAENIKIFQDGERLQTGPITLTAILTPGHTPGGTSWTWQSCEASRCLNIVYADSLSAVSADGYRFTDHPEVITNFEKSIATVENVPCDILVTPHPEFSGLWQRLERREHGNTDALIDDGACRRYAEAMRAGLSKRIAREKTGN